MLYLDLSSLFGWPRRWKVRFSILTFPDWVIPQGAVQEMDVIHKVNQAWRDTDACRQDEGRSFYRVLLLISGSVL